MTDKQWIELLQMMVEAGVLEGFEVRVRVVNGDTAIVSGQGRQTAKVL